MKKLPFLSKDLFPVYAGALLMESIYYLGKLSKRLWTTWSEERRGTQRKNDYILGRERNR